MSDVVIRIATIVIQSIMAIIFCYLGILVLQRDRKRLNVILSGYYFFVVLGTLFNWSYAFLQPIQVYQVIVYLNFITNFFYFTAVSFILVFILIVLKSEKIINTTKQITYLAINFVGLGGVLLILISIPIYTSYPGDIFGVYFPEIYKSTPFWTLPFLLAVIIIISGLSVGPSVYYLLQTLKQFTDPDLKKKFRYFVIGYILIVFYAYIIPISNYARIYSSILPTIALLLGVVFIITGSYLTYVGVGRQISK